MIIIHAGMHKTGSSSIQQTFAKLDGDRVDYAPWGDSNHGGLFFVMFHPFPEKQVGFRNAGDPHRAVRNHRERWGRRFQQMLKRRREQQTTRPMIISAEAISMPERLGKGAVEKMADYLRSHSSEDVRVIAYVRSPQSILSSSAQQQLKAGWSSGVTGHVGSCPDYRDRFEQLDRVFGRENVTLKHFQQDRLEGGDMVLDFAREIGVALDPGEVVRADESLSLEAVAILYVQARTGDWSPPRTVHELKQRRNLVNQISKLGSQRFILSDTLTGPIVEAGRGSVDWMETRLGAPFSEPPVPKGQGIADEADLINAAIAALPLIDQMIADVSGPDKLACEVVRRLDLLGDLLRPLPLAKARKKIMT
ncbi:MAG: hypothetical protein GDA35_10500 [Hyphomonadaceae bacterium]|nr:hypothetical protein [Hyphomonadaceae bacterium]